MIYQNNTREQCNQTGLGATYFLEGELHKPGARDPGKWTHIADKVILRACYLVGGVKDNNPDRGARELSGNVDPIGSLTSRFDQMDVQVAGSEDISCLKNSETHEASKLVRSMHGDIFSRRVFRARFSTLRRSPRSSWLQRRNLGKCSSSAWAKVDWYDRLGTVQSGTTVIRR